MKMQDGRRAAPGDANEELQPTLSDSLNSELARHLTLQDEEVENVVPYATARLLAEAVRLHATDIHLDPQTDGLHVRFRIHGSMQDLAALSTGNGQRLINQMKTFAGLDPLRPHVPVDGRRTVSLEDRNLDLRIVATKCLAGEKVAVRVLDPCRLGRRIQTLGLSDHKLSQIERWLADISGAFLVTGPTGSGKTTTLYALLHELVLLNMSIVTLEDPVEYQMDGVTQLQVNAAHGLTFAEGIKAMLRLDPDYMLLGEIRDAISARAAADAASSGRVLLSTLHSRDAVGAITSLRNWDLENQEICSAVSVIVAQRLVRKLCPTCRHQDAPSEDELRWLAAYGVPAPSQVWHAGSCNSCSGIGYVDQTGVFEVWRLDEEDYESILQNIDERRLRRQLAEKGHGFLLPDGLAKAASGITTLSELRTMGGVGLIGNAVQKAAVMAMAEP